MKFFAAAAFFATALAVPTTSTSTVCPSFLYSQALCCATGVLGILNLDCTVPTDTPRDGRNLQDICAKTGQQAACCTLPLLQQGVLCVKPVGAL